MRREADGILALAGLLPDSKDAHLDTDGAVDQMRHILMALTAVVAADSQSREAAATKLDVLVRIARLLAYEKVGCHCITSSAWTCTEATATATACSYFTCIANN